MVCIIFIPLQCGVLQEDVMSPTLSEKCQFHVIPIGGSQAPTVICDPLSKSGQREEMETDKEGQLSVTINVHVGEWP